jgi:hypothetical protein
MSETESLSKLTASRSGAMTTEKLARAISSGAGAGRHEAYRSWIRIRRRLSSPVSNLQALRVPQYRRALQLLSGLEHSTADALLWLGAKEVREQFPLWPFPHLHPLVGTQREIDRQRSSVPGLLAICREANIRHGVYPGSKIPFVATIDFAVTMGEWDAERLVMCSCKPYEILTKAKNRIRIHERIQMECLYAQAIGATHVLIDGTQFSEVLRRQLDWARPLKEEMDVQIEHARLHKYAEALMRVADDRSLEDAKSHSVVQAGIQGDELTEAYFRASAWLGLIDIDLSHEIEVWKPLRRDRHGFKQQLRQKLLGAKP